MILVLGTPNMEPIIVGNPHICSQAVSGLYEHLNLSWVKNERASARLSPKARDAPKEEQCPSSSRRGGPSSCRHPRRT